LRQSGSRASDPDCITPERCCVTGSDRSHRLTSGVVTNRDINNCTADAPAGGQALNTVPPCAQEAMAITMEPLPLSPKEVWGP
jgi:hypothetical protein